MKQKISTVLFDFDGTVFDTVEGITKSVQYALRKHSMDAELEALRCFAGPPLVDKFMEVYGPGIGELLDALRRAGKKVGLATSKPQQMAELLLERSGLKGCFDAIVGSGSGINNDAKWQIVLRAMETCGTVREESVLVGDTKYDVEGAKKCAIPCVGVSWGYAAPGELEAAGADAIAKDMEALLHMLCT